MVTTHMRLFMCLKGSIVIEVREGKETTLTPGQTFYEGPESARYWSDRKPNQTGEILCALVKDKGAPVVAQAN